MTSELIPEWIGLILTPLAVVGTIALLGSNRPLPNALAFAASFGLVYTLISAVFLLVGRSMVPPEDGSVRFVVSLVMGLVFLTLGLIFLLRKPRERTKPGWAERLLSATPGQIFSIGAVLSLVNPNVVILISGLVIVVTTATSASRVWPAVSLVMASLIPFAIPILAYLLLGERGKQWLSRTMHWMMAHDKVISASTLLFFGVLFAWRGLGGLI